MTDETLRITILPTLIREQAFARLRDAIITGHFKPGDRLIERELCEAMGVSRTSIREVMRRLEAERLIEVEPRRGPTVARISRKQATEIYEVRAVFETLLVRRFTAVASETEVASLRTIFDQIVLAIEAENIPEMIEMMNRFNGHIMDVVAHDVVNDILRQLTARISFLRATSISRKGRARESIKEILAVVEAIERRDGGAAERSIRLYIDNARDAALDRLDAIMNTHSGRPLKQKRAG